MPSTLTVEQDDAIDSIIELPDDSIPKANSGQLVKSSTNENPTTEEWFFDKSVNVPVSSVILGGAWTISSSGASVSARDDAIGVKYRFHIDDINAIDQPTIIANRLLTGEFAVQPIDADTLIDPVDAMVIIPAVAPLLSLGPAEDGQVITGVDLKLTAASVKTNITITLTLNGEIFAQFFFPVAILKTLPDIYHFDYDPPVDVRVGDTLLVNTSSTDGAMVFLGRADTQVKWQQVNLILWDDVDVPTKEDIPNIADRYVRINNQHSSVTAEATGIVANYLPTATTDIGSDFLSNISTVGGTSGVCTTAGSGTFTQGDIIQVSDSRFNDYIFEVEDHTGDVLEIRGVDGTANIEDFTRQDFAFENDSATITKINVSIIRAGVDGKWEQGKGSSTPIPFKVIDLFGSEYQFESDEDESETTSQTFVNKLTLTTPVIPAGDYRGEITCAVTNDTNNKVVTIQTVLDGNSVNESSFSPRNGGDFIVKTSFSNDTLISGVHTLDLNFKAGGTGGTAKIKNARIEVFRVG